MKRRAYRSWKECERIRIAACRCAAIVMAGHPDQSYAPHAWSLSVFFESYIAQGAEATYKNFGPKKPAKLKIIRS